MQMLLTALMLATAIAQPAADGQWLLRTSMDALGKVTTQEQVYDTKGECETMKRHMIWSMGPPVRGYGGTYQAWCVQIPRRHR
jgi:hypothetical protein